MKAPTSKRNRVSELEHQLEDEHNKYMRALADYQNLEKRMGSAISQARSRSQTEIASRFLDVFDDLEKAETFLTDPGLKMVMDRFRSIFESMGIIEIDVLNNEYDPYVAEAVEMVQGDVDSHNHVVEVVQKGYKLGDTVIRPAKVKVAQQTA